ncbi:MAG: MerR family transcriptional regulator [Flavobacteriales bacterium]|nr:MerR family transcriptional regulator [Bacteroidota bacterium]MCB9240281.1 MerR family transcriptional regulator [Flavobacteriales bacterium]
MDLRDLPEKLYYSISEVSNHFGVSQSLLRYWESEFPSIKPKRNKKGTRFFTRKDLEQIEKIYHLVKDQGFTLKGAKERLKAESKTVSAEIETIRTLKNIKRFLQDVHSKL